MAKKDNYSLTQLMPLSCTAKTGALSLSLSFQGAKPTRVGEDVSQTFFYLLFFFVTLPHQYNE